MAHSFANPYSGQEEETCSVSFKAQQEMGAHTTGSPQTEAEFNTSKQLGEWGVVKAKLAQGAIPNGTKVLSYSNNTNGSRGYLFYKSGKLWEQNYTSNGVAGKPFAVPESKGETLIKSKYFSTSIPKSADKSLTEGEIKAAKEGEVAAQYKVNSGISPEYAEAAKKYGPGNVKLLSNGQPVVWAQLGDFDLKPGTDFVLHGSMKKLYTSTGTHVNVIQGSGGAAHLILLDDNGKYVLQQGSNNAKWWIELVPDDSGNTSLTPKAKSEPSAGDKPIAASTPKPAVNTGSDSVGSMSHEDVAAMFVKIKDDLAKEQGLNIKGANPQLDQLVYGKIGEAIGYTDAEVKAKIEAYKNTGAKLSALKKKVLAGTKKVPEGKPAPAKQSALNSPLAEPEAKATAPDPRPNGVPTTATPKVTNDIKAEVKAEIAKEPAKHYTDEDIASAYIIAKDKVVAASSGKWTLYTKDAAMDKAIADLVSEKTGGLTPEQQKVAIANYLASGKKLSALKKQLAKQGAFTPKADTMKKSGAAKTLDEKS